MSVGAFLGVDMPTVPVGDAVFPVLTSKLTVTAAAENGTAPETTGAFSADVLTPARLQASFFYSREDRARFAGMDAALRENLSMGLGDALDAQIVNGTNGLLNGTVLANHDVTTETTYALYREQFAYGRVDGRFAGTAGDIRIVMGSGELRPRSSPVPGQQRQHGRAGVAHGRDGRCPRVGARSACGVHTSERGHSPGQPARHGCANMGRHRPDSRRNHQGGGWADCHYRRHAAQREGHPG